jgi:hypothetical protein
MWKQKLVLVMDCERADKDFLNIIYIKRYFSKSPYRNPVGEGADNISTVALMVEQVDIKFRDKEPLTLYSPMNYKPSHSLVISLASI